MLSWLAGFFRSASSTIGQTVANAVHWALHGLASVVFSVFGLVGRAWAALWHHALAFLVAVNAFAREVWRFGDYLLHHVVPEILHFVETWVNRLLKDINDLYHLLLTWVAALIARIEAAVRSVEHWVLVNIWDPLKKYIDQVWHDLLTWGYYAWWWLTHPDQLADKLIFYLATSAEKYAWELAGILGKFTLNMILRNARRIAELLETIVAAVI